MLTLIMTSCAAIIKKYTVEKPVYDFIAPGDGFGHTFWIVDREEDIARITEEFAKMPALYIADGHHRSWLPPHW